MAKAHLHEQFEILTSGFRMGVKMYIILTFIFFIIHIVIFVGVSYLTWSPSRTNMVSYAIAKIAINSKPDLKLRTAGSDGRIIFKQTAQIVRDAGFKSNVGPQAMKLFWLFLLSGVVYSGEVVILFALGKRAKRTSENEYIRGARLITTEAFWQEVNQNRTETDFSLGQIAMPIELENRGTMFIGKPGAGKTQAFRPIVRRVTERNEKGITYDYKGDFIAEFYNPDQDLIFNIVDNRCLGWRLFNDLESLTDVDAAVASLIPYPLNSTPFWESGARAIFKAILLYLYQHNMTENHHIWHMLTMPTEAMAKLFETTPGTEQALKALGKSDSRQADGMMAVLMQYAGCFYYMAKLDGTFSIKKWVAGDQRNRIFVTNLKDIEDTLRPILSLFIDLSIRKLLSLPDSSDRKIFYFLDEIGTLQRLMIPDLLTTGRSKGACTFIGNQDSGRTEQIYGAQIIDTIDNTLGNRITMAMSGKAADKEARFNIGETEYWEYKRQHSMGPTDFRDGVTINREEKRKLLFLPSDLANLKDLTGLVKLRNYDFVRSNWTYERPQPKYPEFIIRDDLTLESIKAEQERLKREVEGIVVDFAEDGESTTITLEEASQPPDQKPRTVSEACELGDCGNDEDQARQSESGQGCQTPVINKPAIKENAPKVDQRGASAGINALRDYDHV